MGSWGFGPFDSDDAADMIAALVHRKLLPVVDEQNVGRARDGYNEARAAAQVVLLAHGTDILGGPDPMMALNALLRMRMDAVWLANYWRQPRRIAAALEREIEQAEASIRGCKECRKRLGKSGLAALHEKVDAALKTKIPRPTFGRLLPTRRRRTRAARTSKVRARR